MIRRNNTLFAWIIACFLIGHGALFSEPQQEIEKALTLSQTSSKPLLIAFIGSSWCPWSEKLESEVLRSEAFISGLKSEIVFLRIDIPENFRELTGDLKQRFHIEQCPLLVLLDPSGEEISRMGYLPYSAQEFSRLMKETMADFTALKTAAQMHKLPAQELEVLYLKAKKLGNEKYKEKFMEAGLQADKGPFFYMEKYANLIETGKKKDPQVETLRKKILAKDPKNQYGMHLRLAVLDFQGLANKHKKKDKPLSVVEPLLGYLEKFGNQDRENSWKVQLLIAQFLFSKNELEPALEHATASYEAAPDTMKKEIAQSIDYLKSHMPIE